MQPAGRCQCLRSDAACSWWMLVKHYEICAAKRHIAPVPSGNQDLPTRAFIYFQESKWTNQGVKDALNLGGKGFFPALDKIHESGWVILKWRELLILLHENWQKIIQEELVEWAWTFSPYATGWWWMMAFSHIRHCGQVCVRVIIGYEIGEEKNKQTCLGNHQAHPRGRRHRSPYISM